MHHKAIFVAAITASFMLAGAAYAESPYGNPAASGVGGVAAVQGNTASPGTEGSRTMGGNPAEYDTSAGSGAGLGQAAGFSYGAAPTGVGGGERTGYTGR